MYSSLAMLIGLIGREILLQLCDDDGVGDFVVTPTPNTAYTNLLQAINQADHTIDSYLSGRYALPLETTPASIADASANLALCNLYGRRHETDMPAGIEARRKSAMKWLADVQDGRANIPEIAALRGATAISSRSDDDRIFSDSVLEQY